jgi:hypothetical protein
MFLNPSKHHHPAYNPAWAHLAVLFPPSTYCSSDEAVLERTVLKGNLG